MLPKSTDNRDFGSIFIFMKTDYIILQAAVSSRCAGAVPSARFPVPGTG